MPAQSHTGASSGCFNGLASHTDSGIHPSDHIHGMVLDSNNMIIIWYAVLITLVFSLLWIV